MTVESEVPIFSDEAREELGRQALEMSQGEEPAKEEPEADEEAEPDAAEGADDTEDGDVPEGDGPTPEDTLKAVTDAAIAGDSEALAKALGITDSALDTSNRKLRHVRKTLKEAKDLTTNTEAARTELREAFGDVRQAKIRLEEGDVLGAVDCFEKTFGKEFTDIVSEVLELQAGAGGTEGKALRDREAKLKAREEAFASSQKKLKASYDESQARASAESRVGVMLKDHAYIQDKEDVKNVVNLVQGSWNGKSYDITPVEAANQLLAAETARAEKRGLTKAAPKTTKRPKIRKLGNPSTRSTPQGREKRGDIFTDKDRERLGAEALRLSGRNK